VVWQSRKTGTAGQAPTGEAMHTAMVTNTVVLCGSPCGEAAAEGGSVEEERADMQLEEARDVVMTGTETENAVTAANETEIGA
jgi:hypothetical protein